MNKVLWDLFKETGDIKYFNLYKQIEKRSDENDNKDSRRNNNKWD